MGLVETVLQMSHELFAEPEVRSPDGVQLRNYQGPQDIDLWIEIRSRAFARQKVGVRKWDYGDFEAEFISKPWWDPRSMWLAEAIAPGSLPLPVGTVTLARRGDPPRDKPVVHWLAVVPSYRQRGIGRLLIAALEKACWDAGHREVRLETHAAWTEALEFYEALGYRRIG